MREFKYEKLTDSLLKKDIMQLVSEIQKHKGRQNLFIESNPDILKEMLNIAKIQSTESSNRIENIKNTSKRIVELMNEKTTPINRDENEIIGYKDVLTTIHDSYDDIPINSNIILQLHRDLGKYVINNLSGCYKNTNNSIVEVLEDGSKFERFKPLSAFETPEAIENLCLEFNQQVCTSDLEALLLIPCFILDFLAIHPFNDGNGRMSRLLTLLLLYKSGYIVGKYISIEMITEKTKEDYYETLRLSSLNWHEGDNDYLPFVKYFLSVLLNAYREFESRVENIGLDKSTRIENLFKNTLGKLTKKDVQTQCPNISKSSIDAQLSDLVGRNIIILSKKGNTNYYIYNHNSTS